MHPSTDAAIKTAFLERCALSHPSIMLRSNIFEKVALYDPDFNYTEDYELWCRAAGAGLVFFNLPSVQTLYRKHPMQVSNQKAALQHKRDVLVRKKYIDAMMPTENSAIMAEVLSLRTIVESNTVGEQVIQNVLYDFLKLSKHVKDLTEYTHIIARVLKKCFIAETANIGI